MKKYNYLFLTLSVVAIAFSSFVLLKEEKPTWYIIGDSTVRNTNRPQCGWGEMIGLYVDTAELKISNQAMAGRSTRTFVKEGRWEKVINAIKPGDFLIMQFGHNEGSKPDTGKAGYRGVLRGTGEETVELTWKDSTIETVHTYGWYLRKFVKEAKAKGAIPIIASMIPRNDWKDGKVLRANTSYGKWAMEIAQQEGAYFVDLNGITADKYELLGADSVKTFFPNEHTHTNVAGATINAASVIEGIQKLPACTLNKYLLKAK